MGRSAALERPTQRRRSRPSTGSSRRRRGPKGPTVSPAGVPLSYPLRHRSTARIGARTAFAPMRARRPQRRLLVLFERVPGARRPQKITRRSRQKPISPRERLLTEWQLLPPQQSPRLSTTPIRIVFLRRSRLRYRRHRRRCDRERRPHSRQRKFLRASTASRLWLMRGRRRYPRTRRASTIPTATPLASSNDTLLRRQMTSLQTCLPSPISEIIFQGLPRRPGLFRPPITRRQAGAHLDHPKRARLGRRAKARTRYRS